MDTIEKMKQPKTTQHKKKISKSIRSWWLEKKQEDLRHALIHSKQLNPRLTGSFTVSGSITGDSESTGSFGKLLGDASQLSNLPESFTAEISGAFTTDSASFSTRITTEETNVDTLQARNINTGTGLSGGGNLTSDRTLVVDFSDSTLQGLI